MRRLTRPAVIGSALFIGMTLAALPAQADAPAAAEAVSAIPFPPGEGPDWWPISYIDRYDRYERYDTRTLVLTISPGRDARAPERQVTLSCSPYRTGYHPYGYAACQQLARVEGMPSRIRSSRGFFCTREYDPVTVTARGTWDGRYIRYQSTFSNMCTLRAATGLVYRF